MTLVNRSGKSKDEWAKTAGSTSESAEEGWSLGWDNAGTGNPSRTLSEVHAAAKKLGFPESEYSLFAAAYNRGFSDRLEAAK